MKLIPLNNFKKQLSKLNDAKLVKKFNHTFRFTAQLKKYHELIEAEIGKRDLDLDFTTEGKIGRWFLK